MDDEVGAGRINAVEAWAVRATAAIDGMRTELRVDGRSRRLGERAVALRAELDAQLRALEEISQEEDE